MTKAHGTLVYEPANKIWIANFESPHTSMLFKRLFACAGRAVGPFPVSDTIDNCRSLRWFLGRYPMLVTGAARLEQRAQLQVERDEVVERIVKGEVSTRQFELALPARDYQKQAAELALASRGLLVADETGTGKTLSSLCMLTDPRTLPAIVVTLTHLPMQWVEQIKKFVPHLRPYVIKTTKVHRIDGVGFKPDIVILSYSKLHFWTEALQRYGRTLIWDEVQELRRRGTSTTPSLKYSAANHLAKRMDFRCGLSVGPESCIELRGGAFGLGWIGSIAAAWNLLDALPLVDDGYEIARSKGVEGRGWIGNSFGWKPVRNFIRHRCDGPVSTVNCGGRSITLTNDHSIFTIQADGLSERRTSDLTSKDLIPVDNGAKWNIGASKEIVLDMANVCKNIPYSQINVDLRGFTRADFGMKAWEWQNCHKEAVLGTRLPLKIYLANRDRFPVVGPIYCGRGKAPAVPPFIKLSDWAYVLGFFIGDGWISPKNQRVSFAVEKNRVEEFIRILEYMSLGLRPKIRQMKARSVEIRCSHRLFAEVLSVVFGHARCFDKRIPSEWITTWDKDSRRELLRGLQDSDGCIMNGSRNRNRGAYTSTSRDLIFDVLSLLRSLGVVAGVTERAIAKGGIVAGRQIMGKRLSYQLNWSMAALDGKTSGKFGHQVTHKWSRGVLFQSRVRTVDSASAPEFVYDLEMRGHPSFVANGLLVHNSATPIFNFGGEFYNVMECISPGALGSIEEFANEWCGGSADEKASISNPTAFGEYLRTSGLMLRRTRKDIGRELPELQVIEQTIECDPDALDSGSVACEELARLILDQDKDTERGDRMRWAEEFSNKLRQFTGIGKAPFVAEFVRILVEGGEKVVLYGWHRAVYEIYKERLKDFHPVMYTGSESPQQKQRSKDAFCRGESQVMIISLRSGAGLDGLQDVCSVMVFGELDWSPGVAHQCIGRVHRDGQKSPVLAYFLVSEEGSDPIVAETCGIKKMQSDGVLRQRGEPADFVQELEVNRDHIKKLAQDYLQRKGLA